MPDDLKTALTEFVRFARTLQGDEKSEAQSFLDHFFRALGHAGVIEAGATFEFRVAKKPGSPQLELIKGNGAGMRAKGGKKFADLLWPDRVLIEMKSRGEKLEKHYDQTFEYWTHIVPHRPPFVILCNFDEFWIYDFNTQLFDPVDRIPLGELPENIASFNFLLPIWKKPIFGNNRVEVTRKAADQMATVFREIVERGEDRQRAQRFILQLLVSMVAEDIALLPREIVTELLFECAEKGGSSYDLIGGLFRQMAAAKILGEVSTLTKVFNQLRDHHRYIVYTVKNWNDFGCMIGYWLPHENPDEPVRVGIEIQSNPSSPVRKKVIEAFRGWSAGAGRDWKSDGLDDETAWSSIRKGKALQALMGEADQVRAIKNHLLALLKEVEAFRNKYPELPWGGMGESIAGKEDHDLSNDDPLPIELPPEAVPHLGT